MFQSQPFDAGVAHGEHEPDSQRCSGLIGGCSRDNTSPLHMNLIKNRGKHPMDGAPDLAC